jgi:serine/threonine-protein kinase
VVEAIGRGGMGIVYRAVHDQLGRDVAIKELAPELTQDAQFRDRFFSEARTQAQLQHPNIVTIYDLIEDDGYFIVMEFVKGEGLDGILALRQGQGQPLAEALPMFNQILSALDYAHSQGVIHRDVKPSNVIVSDGSRVKLMDFGIALLVGDKRLTQSSQTIGTPVYMSAEQILRPREVDHRTDIYSAAVLFFEMLAGQPPFDAETEYEIKKQHIEAPPPDLSAIEASVPTGVSHAITRALSKDPEKRFASAGEFQRALTGAIEPGSVPVPTLTPSPVMPTAQIQPRTQAPIAPPPPPKSSTGRRPRGLLIGGVVAAALVLIVAVILALRFFGGSATEEAEVAETQTTVEPPPPSRPIPSSTAVPGAQRQSTSNRLPASESPAAATQTVPPPAREKEPAVSQPIPPPKVTPSRPKADTESSG